LNKSKFYSGRKYEESEVSECLLSFSAEYFDFQYAIQNCKIYRIIILTAVLYGCETWSLILREERRIRLFENRVLRKIFGSKRYEMRG